MVWLGFSDPWESKGRLPPQCQPCREIAGLMKRLLTIIVPQLMVNWWLIVVNRVSYGGLIGFSDPWESKDAPQPRSHENGIFIYLHEKSGSSWFWGNVPVPLILWVFNLWLNSWLLGMVVNYEWLSTNGWVFNCFFFWFSWVFN